MDDQDTQPDLSIDHEIDVEPLAVWEALVTDEGLACWMGEGATIEPTTGGALWVPDVATGTPRRGRVDEVDEGRGIDFTWWPEADPSDFSHVSIMLEPAPIGTRVTVTESRPVVATALLSWSWRCALLAVSRSRIRA